MKKRQREILKALEDLGGRATARAIAEKCNLHVNGVAQSLGALGVRYVAGKGGDAVWELKSQS